MCMFVFVLVKAAHWVTVCHVYMCVCCYRQYIEPQWAVGVSVCVGICWALTHSEVCGCECAGLCCALHHSEQGVCVCWYRLHSESQWACEGLFVCSKGCAFSQIELCDVLWYKLYSKSHWGVCVCSITWTLTQSEVCVCVCVCWYRVCIESQEAVYVCVLLYAVLWLQWAVFYLCVRVCACIWWALNLREPNVCFCVYELVCILL